MTSSRVRALDDVAVGEDEAVGREDEARAAAGLGEALPALLAVVVDLHHRRGDERGDGRNDARIRVQGLTLVWGLRFACAPVRRSRTGPPARLMGSRMGHGNRCTVRTERALRKPSTGKSQEFSDISQGYAQVFRVCVGGYGTPRPSPQPRRRGLGPRRRPPAQRGAEPHRHARSPRTSTTRKHREVVRAR